MAFAVVRQRVPMLDASTLEDRTRPALEHVGWVPIRLRYDEPFVRTSGSVPEQPRTQPVRHVVDQTR